MHRPALGLLLAAVALPATPLLAQDQPAPPPPVDVAPPPVLTPPPETAPPPAAEAPPSATTIPPIQTPAITLPPPAAQAPATRSNVRQTVRTTTRTAARPRAEAPVRQAAPAPTAPAATPVAAAPVAAAPAPPAAAPVAAPVETAAPAATRTTGVPVWQWLLAGAAVLIAVIGLLAWRRRRAEAEIYEDYYVEEPAAPVAEPAVPLAYADEAPAEAAPMADEVSVSEPDPADVEAFAATSEPVAGKPWLEFLMRPVRAGVGENDARVDFKLAVANTGSATARDVRISAWMLGAGAPRGSEAERALIEPLDIGVGEDANVEASVALPRAELSADAILPVVVAEARYRLPDGREGRTTASYAVGVPDGDEMVWFDVEHPSGLHEDVEARALGELERA